MTPLRDRDGSQAIAWPWPSLHERFLALLPGQIITVIAGSGTGKTTFVTGAFRGWVDCGLRVGLITTEEAGTVLRERMACAAAGIPESFRANDDFTGISGVQQAAYDRAQTALAAAPVVSLQEYGAKTPDTLRKAIDDVVGEYRAADPLQVLILDHLHELDPDGGDHDLQAFAKGAKVLRAAGQTHRLVVLMVVQPKRIDRAAIPTMYRPVDLHDGKGTSVIEQVSDQVLGLRRCLKPMDPAGVRQAAAEIAAGNRTISDYAVPETEVKLLKRRIAGELAGRTVRLHLRHGALVDPHHEEVPF